MSIRALHYITGDTPQSGFRRIGSSDAFPADDLPLLEHGDGIQERSRIESGASRPSGNGIRQISHLWEYQTGKYGVPVVIQSYAAIGTGRAHGFSEYVLGKVENIAETADAAEMIFGAEGLHLMDVDTFMTIPGKEEIPCPEEVWEPREGYASRASQVPDAAWRLTLLVRYWEQASIRAFSEAVPEAVRVNLGEFSEDVQEETEETIRRARRFFAQVICPGLPRQVQNIASMTAGVNCADTLRVYTALEFDISHNMFAGETMLADGGRIPGKYRLTAAEMEFMEQVSQGGMPEAVTSFFEKYVQATGDREAAATNVPFMADYRVLYALYCVDRIIAEGHAFIVRAELMNEHGNPQRIRDARACYLLMRGLRKLLETEHHLNEIRRSLTNELLRPMETALMQVMLEDMKSDHAEPFTLFRNETTEFYRKYLYQAEESQRPMMTQLMVLDQEASRAPQFVRCYPAVLLRTEDADAQNARLMAEMLPRVIRPLIEEELKKGKVENKYLEYLRSEEFAKNWAALAQNRKTKQAFADFFRAEIQDARKHFLLYEITGRYLGKDELLRITLMHFQRENTKPAARPEGRMLKIAAHGAKEFISEKGHSNAECVSAMNQYYAACFREYGGDIGEMAGVVSELGGSTAETLVLIFQDRAEGARLTPEEAKAAFQTFGGEGGRYARQPQVRDAFAAMMERQLDKALTHQDQSIVEWLSGMMTVSSEYFTVDTTESLRKLFEAARTGEKMKPEAAAGAFRAMEKQASGLDTVVLRAFTEMLRTHRAESREKDCLQEFDWQCEMLNCSPWKDHGDWMAEQRSENIAMVCEDSLRRDVPLDGATLATIQRWLEEGGIQPRGMSGLQHLCEYWLKKGNTTPTEMFLRFFDRIDDEYSDLQIWAFNLAQKRYTQGLENASTSFGDLVRSCRKDTERAGKRLDDLYRDTREQTDAWLQQHFSGGADLGYLIDEQEQIPENTEFHRAWQSFLSERISRQQVELFNRQPNLEKLQALRRDILKRTRDTHPALQAAYQLMDEYEDRLIQLSGMSEYDAVTGMGRIATEMSGQLDRAAEVRKTLCTCLRSVNYPEMKQLQQQSFRHALCAALMRAILTDAGKGERGGRQDGPDWSMVIHLTLGREEIENAARSPYSGRHLPVLQKLLALEENVRLMVTYGMNPEWESQLIHTIHTDAGLRDYQRALAKNRKMAERYQLRFSGDGLEF